VDTGAFRFLARAWRVVLVIGPLLVLAFALVALWMLRKAATEGEDDERAVLATKAASAVDGYLYRVINMTWQVAQMPAVVDLATAESDRTEWSQQDTYAKGEWKSSAGAGKDLDPYRRVADRPVSGYLAALVASGTSPFREILIADLHGRLIFASNRSDDFVQNDEHDWWPPELSPDATCLKYPAPCARVLGVDLDESSGALGYDVVLPVRAGGRPVGVVKAHLLPDDLAKVMDLAGSDPRLAATLIDDEGLEALGNPKQRFIAEADLARLRLLRHGGEIILRLAPPREPTAGQQTPAPSPQAAPSSPTPPSEDEPRAWIRKLGTPRAPWSVAVTQRETARANVGIIYLLWSLATLALFAVAAAAFAVVPFGRAPTETTPGEAS
jgi:hypothetical protein